MTTFLTIAQVAAATGLSAHTLRYYERIGLVDAVARQDNRHRLYGADDLRWLEFVQRLRATQMPIAQMLRYAELRRQGDGRESVSERKAMLRQHALALQAEMRRLAETLDVLDAKVAAYDAQERSAAHRPPPHPPRRHSMNATLATPLRPAAAPPDDLSGAHADASLYRAGLERLREVDGSAGDAVIDALAGISPDLGRYVIEFTFGHVYRRPGLTLQQRELATIAALTALGTAQAQLKVHLHAGLNVGLSRTEITETILQMAVYAGFPAALNGMFAAREVFAAADAAGPAPSEQAR